MPGPDRMPVTAGKGRATFLFGLGIVLLIVGAVFLAVGVEEAVTGSAGVGVPFLYEVTALCIPTTIVPGLVLLFYGWKGRRQGQDMATFAAWVQTYRRISMKELANKLGKPPQKTERIMLECVEKGLVRGFIDRSTDEFVLQEAAGVEHFVALCPGCGNSLQRRYLDGETVQCPYCGTVIAGRSSPRGTSSEGPQTP